MTPDELRKIVDRELDRSDAADPRDVARTAIMRIPAKDREAALVIALGTFIEARIYERQDESLPPDTDRF